MPRPRKMPHYPQAPAGRPGKFCYLFFNGIHHKIGKTTNLTSRDSQLMAGLARESAGFIAAGWFDDADAEEQRLLAMFAGSQRDREVFALGPEQLDSLIERFRSCDPHYEALDLLSRRAKSAPPPQPPPPAPSPVRVTNDAEAETVLVQGLRPRLGPGRIDPRYLQAQMLRSQAPGALLLFPWTSGRWVLLDEDAQVAQVLLQAQISTEVVIPREADDPLRAQGLVPVVRFGPSEVEGAILRLVQAGLHVAQVAIEGNQGLSDSARLLAERDRRIRRIFTPATTDQLALERAERTPWLAAAVVGGGRAALAACNMLSGQWFARWWDGGQATEQLLDELERLAPAEVLVSDDASLRPTGLAPILELSERDRRERTAEERAQALRLEAVLGPVTPGATRPRYHLGTVTSMPGWVWAPTESRRSLEAAHDGRDPLAAHTSPGADLARLAAGQLVRYLTHLQSPVAHQLCFEIGAQARSEISLGRAVRRHLEVLVNQEGGTDGALIRAVDRTMTAMGTRALRQRLVAPLADLPVLNRRLDAITVLQQDARLRATVRGLLVQVGDLERLVQQALGEAPRPSVLAQLHDRLQVAGDLHAALDGHPGASVALQHQVLDPCVPVLEALEVALVPEPAWPAEPPTSSVEAMRLIRPGWNKELDQLRTDWRALEGAIGAWKPVVLADFGFAREQAASVEVRVELPLGYIIDAPATTQPALSYVPVRGKVPPRGRAWFTHAQLDRHTKALDGIPERVCEAEVRAYQRLCTAVQGHAEALQALSRVLAELDVTASGAEYAVGASAVRPALVEEPVIVIRDGRHPSVERVERLFIPNSVTLDARGDKGIAQWLITGANASGKSTLMRQVAVITLLAHAGLFVPAREATIGLVDGIYTRVGAADDLVHGRSTFTYELEEVKHILAQATPRSLVILDEVGRGTDAHNGLAIATAVVRHLHDQTGCRALIATHYHDLAPRLRDCGRLAPMRMRVVAGEQSLTSSFEIEPGEAKNSYGLQLAWELALPDEVCKEAARIYEEISAQERPALSVDEQMRVAAVIAELRGVDPDLLSRQEAYVLVQRLLAQLDDTRTSLTPGAAP